MNFFFKCRHCILTINWTQVFMRLVSRNPLRFFIVQYFIHSICGDPGKLLFQLFLNKHILWKCNTIIPLFVYLQAVNYGYSALVCVAKREAELMPSDVPPPTIQDHNAIPGTVDFLSNYLLERYGMQDIGTPLSVMGDGNCAISMILYGSQIHAA